MPDKFDKVTERARKVLTLAQEEAQRFNHNYIGTEHLLLGLIREGDGVAARVLRDLGVDLDKVRSAVESIIGRGTQHIAGEIGLTPRAKKVIELAVDEARRLNHHYIGTEHLLLGLVREGNGIAAGVLESLGVSLEKVRLAVVAAIDRGATFSAQPSPRRPPAVAPRRDRTFAETKPEIPGSGPPAGTLLYWWIGGTANPAHLRDRARAFVRRHPEDLALAAFSLLAAISIQVIRLGRRRKPEAGSREIGAGRRRFRVLRRSRSPAHRHFDRREKSLPFA